MTKAGNDSENRAGNQERRRVAEAMVPVSVSAKSERTAKVKIKMIMIAPTGKSGNWESKHGLLVSVR